METYKVKWFSKIEIFHLIPQLYLFAKLNIDGAVSLFGDKFHIKSFWFFNFIVYKISTVLREIFLCEKNYIW